LFCPPKTWAELISGQTFDIVIATSSAGVAALAFAAHNNDSKNPSRSPTTKRRTHAKISSGWGGWDRGYYFSISVVCLWCAPLTSELTMSTSSVDSLIMALCDHIYRIYLCHAIARECVFVGGYLLETTLGFWAR